MRVLVLYHAGFTFTPTIFHYLDAFRRHSAHEVEFFNIDDSYNSDIDFSAYDALFLNFCVASVARYADRLGFEEHHPFFGALWVGLRQFRGLKIAAVQDEYDFTDAAKAFFLGVGVNVILTNVPQEAVTRIYPEPAFREVRFETVQTAYLADELLNSGEQLPLAERPIVLGYRGRELSYRLGDLAWHKSEVGHRFSDACDRRGIPCDIAVHEGARFNGDAWLGFVRSCRVMLGTQSGANVFDFDGSLADRMAERQKANLSLRYEEVRDEVAAYAVDFDMGQISARVFEAAASRTALALIRGSYSGVIEPDEHYLPIEPDYSNVNQVLDRVLDVPAMQAMADRAYAHVVGDPRNRYSALIGRVDALIWNWGGPAGEGAAPAFRVTPAPLGNDPYLFQRILQLRERLTAAAHAI